MTPGVIVEVVPPDLPGIERTGEEGILVGREARPDDSWLRQQFDRRWRDHADADWWAVMPLRGGLILVPEPLLRFLRSGSKDDVMMAVDHANDHGRRTIASLYPSRP